MALAFGILCLFVSGFVSGSEIAFFSLDADDERLDDSRTGDRIRDVIEQPERLLATILIANNLVNVTIVVLCNFALGPVFSGMSAVLSFVLQTVILTFLILLFGNRIRHNPGAASDERLPVLFIGDPDSDAGIHIS